jgi:hypothetical protein
MPRFLLMIIFLLCLSIGILVPQMRMRERFVYLPLATPTFWDKWQTHRFLQQDADRFVLSMDPVVFAQRDAPSKKEYMRRSSATAVSFTEPEKKVLANMTLVIDRYLRASKLPPWIFAATEGDVYEGGVPHVRGSKRNVYFLSTRTLQDQLHDRCQLGWTLLYLRMHTMFPRNPAPRPSSIHLADSQFPRKKDMPTCTTLFQST